jgi:TRAP-type mannitol/chloroaromatic compound transport system permease small subunit
MSVCAIVVWLSLSYVAYSWNIGEGSANPGGIPARYLLKSLIPIGFTLLFIQSIAQAIHSYYAWQRAP